MDPHRIDVHNHILPPEYVSAMARHGIHDGGDVAFPRWSAEEHLAVMDRCGIAAAVTSLSAPGVYFGDAAAARSLARQVNEIQARMVSDHPKRFGGFATLPVPDMDGALDELAYALDVLKLDGVVMLTSLGDVYLGDPSLEPLFAELNRRKAVVFVHPNTPASNAKLTLTLPAALVEFVFDTTRAVANLIFSGTLERHPDVKIILSHAGGTVPYLAGRLSATEVVPGLRERAPKGAVAYLKNLYYDTALSAFPTALGSLRELVDPSHILFGSDYPFAPESVIEATERGIEGYTPIDAAQRNIIEREAALALFPRLRG
jgi:predicted TIM-barrel fold metal-dependent hydrolase